MTESENNFSLLKYYKFVKKFLRKLASIAPQVRIATALLNT
jgi:hypothetical protein